MKLKLQLCILFILASITIGQSKNDKYRLILVDNPSTTLTIAWNQVSGTNPIVYYGTEDFGSDASKYPSSKGVDRTTNFRGMSNRFARLTNLKPNTAYYFVIKDSEGVSKRFWFKTAPADTSTLFFIAGGDSRNNRQPRRNANLLVSKLKPHAVFFGGDMTDDDTNNQWRNWLDDWQLTIAKDGRMFPIVPARGNHERSNSVYNLFDTPNANSYYAITWGDNLIRTYTLNTEISVLGDQLTWLTSDLKGASKLTWKMAQYHKPMRPHTAGKSEGNSVYNAWAKLFYDNKVRLVVDCDSHMAKTTWPIKPSNAQGNDEGFVIDKVKGTVYTGEGCWGAPLRPNNDSKSWTRSSGSFNQFKVIFVAKEAIELRTINVNNATEVTESTNENPFELPENLNIFKPSTGAVVVIKRDDCEPAGTPCDDGNAATYFDVEDGDCNCAGISETGTVTYAVASSNDDAEEDVSSKRVNVTSTDLELVNEDGSRNQLVGVRFTGVHLPAKAKINNAYIQFTADSENTEQTNLEIRAEATANALTFAVKSANISSRKTGSRVVSWNNVPKWNSEDIGIAGVNQRTPNISALVEEILAQPNWKPLQPMTFIINGKGEREAESFDGTAPPKLIIEYSLANLSTEDMSVQPKYIKVYPNPAKHYITVASDAVLTNVSVVNLSGQEVYRQKPHKKEIVLDVRSLKSGVYFIRIARKKHEKSIIKKIVIE